jgi:hypothetical protein
MAGTVEKSEKGKSPFSVLTKTARLEMRPAPDSGVQEPTVMHDKAQLVKRCPEAILGLGGAFGGFSHPLKR